MPHGHKKFRNHGETLARLPMVEILRFLDFHHVGPADPYDPWEDFLKKKKFPKFTGKAFLAVMCFIRLWIMSPSRK